MSRGIPPMLVPLYLLLALTSIPFTAAQSFGNNTTFSSPSSSSPSASPTATTPTLKIGDGSGSIYTYIGCWNESAGLPGTTGLRALDGNSEALPGEMTVAKCLSFCARGDSSVSRDHRKPYRLAGLEYSNECWCGDEINPLAVRLQDKDCDFPCDGANDTACGGSLKLSLYNATAASLKDFESSAAEWRAGGAWGGMLLGSIGLALACALGGL